MPRRLRTSLVEHPSAILFLLISRVGVFQHPRLVTTVISSHLVRDAEEKSRPDIERLLFGYRLLLGVEKVQISTLRGHCRTDDQIPGMTLESVQR
jgi:hypothetical protein